MLNAYYHYIFRLISDPAMIERIRSTFVGHYSLDMAILL